MTQQTPTQRFWRVRNADKTFAQSDLVQIAGNWVCGDCKPAFLSRVMAGGLVAASSLSYAGVGIRFGARLYRRFGVSRAVSNRLQSLVMPNMLRTAGDRTTLFNGTFVPRSFSACFTKS